MLWAADTPSALARAVGAPAAVAFHVGPIDCDMPGMPGVPFQTIMTGESQIVRPDGQVLARLSYDDGEGIIAATVDVGTPKPANEIPSSFWLRPNTFLFNFFWHYMKTHGRARFLYDMKMGRFAWQDREHADLPGYNPGASKTEQSEFGGPGPFDKRTEPKPRPLAHTLYNRCWVAARNLVSDPELDLTAFMDDPQVRLPEIPTAEQPSDQSVLRGVAE
jgi:hypothetical protein